MLEIGFSLNLFLFAFCWFAKNKLPTTTHSNNNSNKNYVHPFILFLFDFNTLPIHIHNDPSWFRPWPWELNLIFPKVFLLWTSFWRPICDRITRKCNPFIPMRLQSHNFDLNQLKWIQIPTFLALLYHFHFISLPFFYIIFQFALFLLRYTDKKYYYFKRILLQLFISYLHTWRKKKTKRQALLK